MTPVIALLTATAYPAVKAGTEVYVHHLANALSNTGFRPIVITKEPVATSMDVHYPIKQWHHGDSLVSVLKEARVDLVHFHSIHEGGFTLGDVIALKRSGFRVMATFHLANNTCLTNDLWRMRQKTCKGVMNRIDCTACYLHKKTNLQWLSHAWTLGQVPVVQLLGTKAQRTPGLTLGKVTARHLLTREALDALDLMVCIAAWYKDVLHANGVNKEKIAHIPQLRPAHSSDSRTVPSQKTKVLFVGRIVPEKGIHDLAEAWSMTQPSNLELTLVGQLGQNLDQRRFTEFVDRHSEVRYLGEMSHEDTMNELSQNHILVLGSRFSEMSPLVVGEAQNQGLAVIGSDSPGVAEACKKGEHVIYPRGDVRGLANVLSKIDQNRQVFEQAKSAFDGVTSEELAHMHAKMYHDLLTSSQTDKS